MTRSRVLPGIALTLVALAAAIAATRLLADNSSVGLDPDGKKLAVEFTIAFGIALGFALGGAVEGWIRGDEPHVWWEALFYRTFIGGVAVFVVIAGGVVVLDRLGVGSSNL